MKRAAPLLVLVPFVVPLLVLMQQYRAPTGPGIVDLRGRWAWSVDRTGPEQAWKGLQLPGVLSRLGVERHDVWLRRAFDWAPRGIEETHLLVLGELRTSVARVLVNGHFVGDIGAFETEDKGENDALEALVVPTARLHPGSNELLIHLKTKGMLALADQRLLLGPASTLGPWHLRVSRIESFLRTAPILVFPLLGLLVVVLLLLRLEASPLGRRLMWLLLALTSSTGLYLQSRTGLGLSGWVDPTWRASIGYILIIAVATFFVEFSSAFFLPAPTWPQRVNRAVAPLSAVLMVVLLLLTADVFRLSALYLSWALPLVLHTCVRVLQCLRRRHDASAYLMAGAALVYGLSGVADMATDVGLWQSPRLFAASLATTPLLAGIVVVGHFIGLAERNRELTSTLRQTHDELSLALDEAREADRLKAEFLASVSHELRTPLNAIINLPEGLLEDYVEHDGAVSYVGEPSESRRYLATLLTAGRSLLGVVSQVLDFSTLDAGRITPVRESVAAEALFGTALDELTPLARARGIQLETSGALQAELRVDRALVSRVLVSLGNNALKFSSRGATVRLHATSSREAVDLQVIDAGIGIAKEHQALVFEAFRQVEGGSTRRFGGTGLGLAISRKIAELHGGVLTVESEPGQGSTFTLHLPRTWDDLPVRPERPAKSNSAPTIVVVDDEPMVLETLRLSLRHLARVNTVAVEDPREALQTIERVRPALVLLDVMMPWVSGLSLLRALRESPELRHIPVLVLSAYTTNQDLVQQLGARWMSKPWNTDALTAAVRELAGLDDFGAPAAVEGTTRPRGPAERRSV